jgi:hypothetical protein
MTREERLTVTVNNEPWLRAMAEAVAAYEAEFGAITPAEMAAQQQADENAAVAVLGRPRPPAPNRQR